MKRLKVNCIIPSSPWLADSKTNVPLGVLYIAAVLREAGHDVTVTSRLGYRPEGPYEWSQKALEADIHLIGFCSPQFNESLDLVADLRKKCPGALFVAGGPHPSYEPEETKRAGNQYGEHPKGKLTKRRDYTAKDGKEIFDSVIVMEGEIAIMKLIKDWQAGELKEFYYGAKEEIPNLDVVPFPAWDLLPMDHIHNDGKAVIKGSYFPNEKYPDVSGGVLSIIGCRGCPYKCVYCSTPWIGQAPRYRSSHNIIMEMQKAFDAGVRMFKFQDDTYTLHRTKMKQLSDDMHAAFGEGSYAVRMHTRVNTMDDDIAKTLLKINTKVCCYGVESGSQKVLDANWKGTKVKQATEAVKCTKRNGIQTVVYLVSGLAGETLDTARETQEWLKEAKPYIDNCNLAVGIPYPGSRFWSHPEECRIEILDYNYDNYWIVGFSAREEILVRPYDVTVDEMMKVKEETFQFLKSEGWIKAEWDEDSRIKDKEIVHV